MNYLECIDLQLHGHRASFTLNNNEMKKDKTILNIFSLHGEDRCQLNCQNHSYSHESSELHTKYKTHTHMFSQTFVPLGLSCAPWHRGVQGRAHSRAHSRAHPGRSVSILTPTPSTQTHATGPMNMETNVCNMCSIVPHHCQVNLERHFPTHRDALGPTPPSPKESPANGGWRLRGK